MTCPKPLLLDLEHILDSHQLMIEQYGGAPGILNAGLLESVIGSVRLATQYAELNVFQVAAKYGYKLVMNHLEPNVIIREDVAQEAQVWRLKTDC